MNTLILASGAGSRFKKEGYLESKPFIEVNSGLRIIDYSIRSVKNYIKPNNIYVAIQKIHEKNFNKSEDIADIALLDKLTKGPAESALIAIRKLNINYNEPIFIVDCDIYFELDHASIIDWVINRKTNACLTTFKSNNPAFSYLFRERNSMMYKTIEKKALSDDAICGCYGFRSCQIFEESYSEIYVHGSGEQFMSSLYNSDVINGDITSIPVSKHLSLGTPIELGENLSKLKELK